MLLKKMLPRKTLLRKTLLRKILLKLIPKNPKTERNNKGLEKIKNNGPKHIINSILILLLLIIIGGIKLCDFEFLFNTEPPIFFK